jgi:hypothetical protein
VSSDKEDDSEGVGWPLSFGLSSCKCWWICPLLLVSLAFSSFVVLSVPFVSCVSGLVSFASFSVVPSVLSSVVSLELLE